MATQGTGAACAAKAGLGAGWKISPSICVAPGGTACLADIEGPGQIVHIWLTTDPARYRQLVLSMTWDNAAFPAVYTPLGDFFCNGWCERALVDSLPVAVNPAGGFNTYFSMPFRSGAQITLQNLSDAQAVVYYQIDYRLESIPEDTGYFHAAWARSSPLADKEVHTILNVARGRGHYVGTYLAWQSNSNGWWGEGEVKMYLDGDGEYPTICGTGTEDYFGGAWNFDVGGRYEPYSTPFLGLPQVIRPDGLYRSQQRFGMYRWHILDPVYFAEDIRVTIQALGWREAGRAYLPLKDDIASTAFWYQDDRNGSGGAALSRELLDVI